jgi:hypothetical protein
MHGSKRQALDGDEEKRDQNAKGAGRDGGKYEKNFAPVRARVTNN